MHTQETIKAFSRSDNKPCIKIDLTVLKLNIMYDNERADKETVAYYLMGQG